MSGAHKQYLHCISHCENLHDYHDHQHYYQNSKRDGSLDDLCFVLHSSTVFCVKSVCNVSYFSPIPDSNMHVTPIHHCIKGGTSAQSSLFIMT